MTSVLTLHARLGRGSGRGGGSGDIRANRAGSVGGADIELRIDPIMQSLERLRRRVMRATECALWLAQK